MIAAEMSQAPTPSISDFIPLRLLSSSLSGLTGELNGRSLHQCHSLESSSASCSTHEILGSGCSVILARHRVTDNMVVIKRWGKHWLHHAGRKALERCQRECHVLAHLSQCCPNIIAPLLYALQSPRALYIVLQPCMYGDLASLLHRVGRVRECVARMIIEQLIRALQCLHKEGIIHRDLKPSNIGIDDDGRVRLLDFGLCAINNKKDKSNVGQDSLRNGDIEEKEHTYPLSLLASSSSTIHSSPVGSLPYVSPELLIGGGYDHRIDLWSLGVIMFELLTGYLPFGSETSDNDDEVDDGDEEMKDRIIDAEIRWPMSCVNAAEQIKQYGLNEEKLTINQDAAPADSLSPAAISLLLGLLCPDPEKRLGSNDVMSLLNHPFFDASLPRHSLIVACTCCSNLNEPVEQKNQPNKDVLNTSSLTLNRLEPMQPVPAPTSCSESTVSSLLGYFSLFSRPRAAPPSSQQTISEINTPSPPVLSPTKADNVNPKDEACDVSSPSTPSCTTCTVTHEDEPSLPSDLFEADPLAVVDAGEDASDDAAFMFDDFETINIRALAELNRQQNSSLHETTPSYGCHVTPSSDPDARG